VSKSMRILVVDDDPGVLEIFSELLRTQGYEVMEAATGLAGLQMTRDHRPDLVLLDVRMPDISGIEVCRQIKADVTLADVFVVLFSGEATSTAHKVDGLEIGADEYLVKGTDVAEFLTRIRMLVRLRNSAVALRASEQHYRRLIEILPEAVGLVDLQGRLLAINPQGIAMLNCASPEELLARSILDLTPPEDHDRMRRDLTATLKTGSLRNAEYTALRKGGEAFPVEVNAAVWTSGSDQPAGIVLVVRDMTQRKRAEEQLRKLSRAVEQSPASIVITDPQGNIEHINAKFTEVSGYTLDEVRGKNPRFLKSGQTPAEEYVRLWRTITSGHEWHGDLCNKKKNGELFWEDALISPITDDAGRVTHFLGVKEDITERRRAEATLRDSEERYRSLVNNLNVGVFRTTPDAEGRFLQANPALARIHGYGSVEEFQKVPIVDLYQDPRDREVFLAELMRRKKVLDYELHLKRKDGKPIYAAVSAAAHPGTDGTVDWIDGMLEDITERKHAENELRKVSRLIIEAQEAERMRVARELHDGVNQLLASIQMRLQKVKAVVPEFRPAAREILARCHGLLVQALEENRRIAHNLRPTELDQLGLTAACRNLSKQFEARTNVAAKCRITKLHQNLAPTVELNVFRIVQEAFNNVEKHARAKAVSLKIYVQDQSLVVRIQDDGRGFDLEQLSRAKRKDGGIGLASIRERAAALGGTCEISSAPTRGTTITVQFPSTPAR